MWRFVVVCFFALGWLFYELSGGADYEPSPNSLQVRAELVRPKARPQPQQSTRRERTLAQVEATMGQLEQAQAKTEKLSVTLAATRTDGLSIIEAETTRPKAELLALKLPPRQQAPDTATDTAIDAAITSALGMPPADPARLRWVKQTVVALRSGPGLTFDNVAQIAKGTEVAILEDPGHGWLKVQVSGGYQTGWLAEWLLTAPQ